MTDNYDNWEKLVGAVLRREQLRELALLDSRSSSSLSSSSSSFNLGPISPLPSYHEYAFELPESTSYGERLLSEIICHKVESFLMSMNSHLHNNLGMQISSAYVISKVIVSTLKADFFKDHGEASRYRIQEVIGEGSSGVVCSAIDTHTGERVAIKKIANVFDNLSDAMQTLREIKLLKLLRHPDLVYTRDIVLPPSWTGFRHSYVVFELMKSDLHEVIRANEDLTTEQHRFFMYQLLRGLKYIHTANVFHRDLKPKNILANADCKLKICDFGLARVAFNDAPTPIFWTDYFGNRGIVLQSYVCTPAIDIWSIGCIFAEMLAKRPLFCGKSVVHQLDLITDLLGVPKPEALARIRNEKARRYLSSMKKKKPIPFVKKFPNADPLALRLLERLLAFDPKERPTAEEALADPTFTVWQKWSVNHQLTPYHVLSLSLSLSLRGGN
ncbi:Mitogen-activated protein kinase [Sesamum angolense]|uniref:Mitogen-activated protein kinase n=1 Tax=Sesamum angolense TaxID=2727404 RepID=A0AAE2C6U3_9LAMI|nr:Mitogen-activated protein kinase [Sesamum angolense]